MSNIKIKSIDNYTTSTKCLNDEIDHLVDEIKRQQKTIEELMKRLEKLESLIVISIVS